MPGQTAIYLRISEDRSGEGLAVERQREDAHRLAELRGWQIVAEYVDNDLSAAGRTKRPGWEALLRSVDNGELDVVIAWAFDRLARNPRDRLRMVETCRKNNVTIALVRGTDMDPRTPSGRLVIGVLGETAQYEIDQKSDRQKRANRQAAEQGRMTGGPRAFGFLPGGIDHDPVEAPLLAEAYDRWLAGADLEELADWLNRATVTTTRGKRWRGSTVRVVLANPRNAGLRALRPIVDEDTGRRSMWHDPPVAKAVWSPIVSEETYGAALARLRDPARHGATQDRNKGPRPRYLLSGIARCGFPGCGQHMITGIGGNKTRRYHCTTKRHINRRADYIDAFVVQTMLDRLERDDLSSFLLPQRPDAPSLDAVRAEQLVKRERLRELAADYAAGVLDRDQVRVAGALLRERLAELDAVIADAGRVDVLAPLLAAEDPAMVWDDYPMSTRRVVVDRLMEITVHRANPGRPPGGVYDTSTIKIRWRDQGGS